MDIKNSEEKLKQVDSFLTTLTKLLKKHWLILILIGIGAFFYFALTSEDAIVEEPEEYYEEDVSDSLEYDSTAYYQDEL